MTLPSKRLAEYFFICGINYSQGLQNDTVAGKLAVISLATKPYYDLFCCSYVACSSTAIFNGTGHTIRHGFRILVIWCYCAWWSVSISADPTLAHPSAVDGSVQQGPLERSYVADVLGHYPEARAEPVFDPDATRMVSGTERWRGGGTDSRVSGRRRSEHWRRLSHVLRSWGTCQTIFSHVAWSIID